MDKNNNFSTISNANTGFGPNADNYGGRFINKDGSFNLRKEGISIFRRFSLLHAMINMPLWKFSLIILLFFIGINIFYTLIYILLGMDGLRGYISLQNWGRIKEIFYFSAETFTTVGYGRINPVSDGTNLVAAFEAVNGFLTFAITTSLFYGRMTKPAAHLVFSEYALISPYRNKKGLMFRFASYKDKHTLSNVEVKVNLALLVQDDGVKEYKFYDLTLERTGIDNLPMNFTVVHPLDENSPLTGLDSISMQEADVEIYVLVRGFDNVYASTVLQRTSYTYKEIKFDAKFVPMYRESRDGKTTILEIHKLNEHVKLEV